MAEGKGLIDLLDTYRIHKTELEVEMGERHSFYGWVDHIGEDHFVLALAHLAGGLPLLGRCAAIPFHAFQSVSVAPEPKVAMRRPQMRGIGHHPTLKAALEDMCAQQINVAIFGLYPRCYYGALEYVGEDHLSLRSSYPERSKLIPYTTIRAVEDVPRIPEDRES